MQLPLGGVCLRDFDEFAGLLQEIGVNFLMAFNFYGALSKTVGGQPS